MLVLSRKPGEAICIGDTIKVVIVSKKGDNIGVGIIAPREVPVDREEVREAKQRRPRNPED